ncbi:hypothetical protein NA57DRAFT_80190 [Rhizodiscina lignyota]|uniref:Uncharacterized protein n=1 Tax=Rhizodiscina lignyota TaxID=1504668 RepID=A0A9P4M185_9PEZI|nr:hypothetical protein NA57DRAFT_80190 [Rhizodiscina lignyota]
MRRMNTAPSPTILRHRPSPQTFSITASSDPMSLSSSPASFPTVAPRTPAPAIDTNVQPVPMFYDADYSYPLFGGPVVVEPSSFVPTVTETPNFFREQTLGLLTPISHDQGYESSCSPMTTMSMSSLSLPFLPFGTGDQGAEHVMFQPHAPSPAQFTHSHVLQAHGLDLDLTMRELSELGDTLSGFASSPIGNDDHRIEQLLRATERVHSLLQPYFTLSPHSPTVAQSLDISTLGFMINTVLRATDAYHNVISPGTSQMQSHTGQHIARQASPPTRAISPQALSIHSSMPVQPSPHLQPSTPAPFATPMIPGSSAMSVSSPMLLSNSIGGMSPVPAIAPAMSTDVLPIAGPTMIGNYISHQVELSRWVLANIMLFHIRSLSQLQKRMEVCLSFCAPASISESLERLRTHISSVNTQIRTLIDMFGDADR